MHKQPFTQQELSDKHNSNAEILEYIRTLNR
jgi:hypothetical protein